MATTSFTFHSLVQQEVTWNLTDETGVPITGATLIASLYVNRDRFTPGIYPGVIDGIFQNITLVETPGGSGSYIGQIPENFNPLPAVSGYITVITAVSGVIPLGTFEIPTVVIPPQNNIDLVTLNDVKQWLGLAQENNDCDNIIQLLITSFSQYVINKTGRDSFKSVNQYTEVYDGNGNSRLFLNNTPIRSIVSLQIGTYAVPFSSSITSPGIFIDQSGKSVAFRASGFSAPLSIYPYVFMRGTGNIQVVYTAGYSAVPYDLAEITIETVAQNYKRKDWIDLMSKHISTPGVSGTTTYRAWAMTPFAQQVLDMYSRYARA